MTPCAACNSPADAWAELPDGAAFVWAPLCKRHLARLEHRARCVPDRASLPEGARLLYAA
jgi:hypothetical protein